MTARMRKQASQTPASPEDVIWLDPGQTLSVDGLIQFLQRAKQQKGDKCLVIIRERFGAMFSQRVIMGAKLTRVDGHDVVFLYPDDSWGLKQDFLMKLSDHIEKFVNPTRVLDGSEEQL